MRTGRRNGAAGGIEVKYPCEMWQFAIKADCQFFVIYKKIETF